MQSDEFIKISKRKIIEGFYRGNPDMKKDDVLLIWFCKTIQNWKGIFTTKFSDGKIFEVTYNGDREELYIDEYIKSKKLICDLTERCEPQYEKMDSLNSEKFLKYIESTKYEDKYKIDINV